MYRAGYVDCSECGNYCQSIHDCVEIKKTTITLPVQQLGIHKWRRAQPQA